MRLDCHDAVTGFLYRLAEVGPKDFQQGENQLDATLLSYLLGKELTNELFSVLNRLRVELVPKYAEDMSLHLAFWDELICEVSDKAETHIADPIALDTLVEEFGDRWKRPLAEYDVACLVRHLSVGAESVEVSGVEFTSASQEELAARSLSVEQIRSLTTDYGYFTLAVTRVEAATSATAAATGREKVVEALVLLRASALSGRSGNAVVDELLQWELSGDCLVRPVAPGDSGAWVWSFRRPFGPLVIDLGEAIRKGFEQLQLGRLDDLPDDIRQRVRRSLYWIAHSASHASDDHRLVDFMTAMEILLLPEDRLGNKGATIALRYNLIGGSLNPPAVKRMYDLRNEVVHGGKLPIVGQLDAWHTRLTCCEAVGRILAAAAERTEASTLGELISGLETADRLSQFIKRAEQGTYEGVSLPQIVEEAKRKLQRIAPPGQQNGGT